ncbi:MAG: cell division protein FtsA [Candidatus Magasanikbacteria bacterium]|jgi:cell division protein FtsA|nr:cell division protein FtsA [Candidatus Magasanikbacteria bacterium]MBT4221180.1 cell division protein FtsA [Candidatus Magasanikbacteria bacterium]MBT4350250.1 cell division protein FtsA [Candidatus Magasanikbacteria bacterium]MBT4541677.1 cell division protein FtsA [Candidatus Magasanikbacteria bacterium]MBT6253347.1 cell division protein FtsA [Candidatus Magasanikbacteria bacterium]
MIRKKKNNTGIITGIDIGSSAIRIAVGQESSDMSGKPQLQIIATIEVPSEGISKGVISSIEETVSSISNALEHIERLTGIPVEHVWIGMSGMHIISQESRGVVAIATPHGEIGEDDAERAIEAARTVAAPLNYEVLHVIPRSFSVDGQTDIKDPVGMTGIRLEVVTQMIHGATAHIKNVMKAVYRTGVDIDDLVLSTLATGDVVATSRQKELGTAVIDIGSSTTSVIVYESGDIIHTGVVPIGSAHVTNDLAIGLRTSIDMAERVKIHYGNCIAKGISKKDKIRVSTDDGKEEEFSLQYVAEIIEARMTEILERVDQELQLIGRSGLLPAGVMFVGGGSKIERLIELTKEVLRLPASIGTPINIQGITEDCHNIAFAPAIGLVRWGAGVQQGTKKRRIMKMNTGKVIEQFQKLFKSLIP